MRWFIFITLYCLLTWYSFQAVKTLTKNTYLHFGFLGLVTLVLSYFLYHWLQPYSGSVFTGNRSLAFGFVLAVMAAEAVIVLFMFGEDILRFLYFGYQKLFTKSAVEALPSRRKFVSTLALGLAAIPFASLLYGMWRGKYNFKVLEYELTFDDLPEAFDGYRITQISDVHSGSFDNHKKIEYAVDLINQQQSDAIVFTGDLVNNRADEMQDWKNLFKKLDAKDGVFSILGNHDYGDYVKWNSAKEKKENLQQLKKTQNEMGWDLLLNEHRTIERNQQKIAVVGVENWGSGGFVKHGDIDKASQNLSEKDFKIVLSHDPSYWDEHIRDHDKNYQLTLSGHTHGMQFGIEIPGWFKWSPVQFRYKHWAGIYKEKNRFINVNRGFGFLAYPGRVGMWPEITVVKLKKSTI